MYGAVVASSCTRPSAHNYAGIMPAHIDEWAAMATTAKFRAKSITGWAQTRVELGGTFRSPSVCCQLLHAAAPFFLKMLLVNKDPCIRHAIATRIPVVRAVSVARECHGSAMAVPCYLG